MFPGQGAHKCRSNQAKTEAGRHYMEGVMESQLKGPGWSSKARVERFPHFPFIKTTAQFDPYGRLSLFSFPFLVETAAMLVQLRPSIATFFCRLLEGWARWSPPARVQRGSSETARCTSKGDRLACPLSFIPKPRPPGAQDQHGCQTFFCSPIRLSVPFQSRRIFSLCLIQISALTMMAKTRNSCRCSFTIATTGNSPKAASAPPDE
jgi:hypothetical protein